MKKKSQSDKLKQARKKADRKFQETEMAKGSNCELCGAPAVCIHHIIEKSLSARLRYESINGIRVCNGCHYKIHNHSDPAIFRKIDAVIGQARIKKLETLRREPVKISLEYYASK